MSNTGWDVFDFDRCSGMLGNHKKVYYSQKIHNGVVLNENPALGLSFSPNSRFAYLSLANEVLQLDLWPQSETALQKIADYDGFADYLYNPIEGLNLTNFAFSRLAPDGRIYSCSTMPTGYFHVYEQPNEKGLASKVVQRGLELKGIHSYSIPNHPNYRLGPLEGSACDTLGIEKAVFIHAHPYPMEGCVGGGAHFEVTAFGTGKGFQWQRSTDGGTVWEDLLDDSYFMGTGTEYLVIKEVLNEHDGNMFRCIVTGDVSTEISRPATLSVIGELPTAAIATENDLDKIYFINGSAGDEYVKWYFGDGDSSILESPSHVYQNMGSFAAMLVATNACGNDTTYQEINIGPVLADFKADRTVGCPPMEVTFESKSSYRVSNHNFNTTGASQGLVSTPHREATVTYNTPGIFDVGLTVYAPGPEIGDTIKQDYISVLSGTNPTAEIDLQQNGSTVQLNTPFDLADSYTWHFANGDTLTGQMAEYTFPTPGLYQVQLETANHCGTATGSVEVLVGEPHAAFTADQQQGCAPFTMQFENTTDFSGASYEWHFQGGLPTSSTEENPVVVYEAPGIYEVILIAHADSLSDTLTQNSYIVVFTDDCPQPNIYVQPNGLEVTFWTDCTNGISYLWDMGDGTTVGTQGVAYQYEKGGTYEITLMVEGPCGIDTVSTEINVTGPNATGTIQQEKHVSLVPNPASGKVQVISKNGFPNGATLKVYNALGAQVLENKKAVWKQQEVIALDGLAGGVYFFRFESMDGQVQVGKLVVE